jgi:very-long-chain ceramide synthase
MSAQPTWWYRTEHFWIDYPHWRMLPELKTYYLLQLANWLQQVLVLVLKLERPRSDFIELCIHVRPFRFHAFRVLSAGPSDPAREQHVVTIWLIGWSYTISLTYIGVAIFVSMDIPDTFLAVRMRVSPSPRSHFKQVWDSG